MRNHSLAIGAALAGLWAGPALALGDGARAYLLVPKNINIGSLYGIFIDGNASLDPATAIEGAELSVDVAVLQYTRNIDLGGRATGLFMIVPVGRTEGNLTIDRPLLPPIELAGRSSGLGDVQFGAVFGLVGSPALDLKSYAQMKPGFALGALARVTAPTGDYSGSRAINLGANRWAFQLGAPMGYVVGQSMLDPALMTFEMLPSITFYGNNGDPFSGDVEERAPLFRLEAHATRNLSRALWIGIDLLASSGGATTTDGVAGDNRQSSLELGGTVGLNLSRRFSVKGTFGGVVARNDSGLRGTGFRLVGTTIF